MLLLLLAVLATGWLLRARLFGNNLYEVVPGQVYRSAQIPPAELRAKIEELGLRSVVNLRGVDPSQDWYPEQQQIADAAGVELHSLLMVADRLPSRQTLRQLVYILDGARRPLLIHCGSGTDRTGLAAALAVLLADGDLASARAEFGLRYGHLGELSPSDLDQAIDLYAAWLDAEGETHRPENLRRFVREGYTPYFYDARIEAVRVPERIAADEPGLMRFRVTNESPRPWEFTLGGTTGVRMELRLRALPGTADFDEVWTGQRVERVFRPGESIELDAELPALPGPGRYRLTVDLVDELVTHFSKMGSRPLVREIQVR